MGGKKTPNQKNHTVTLPLCPTARIESDRGRSIGGNPAASAHNSQATVSSGKSVFPLHNSNFRTERLHSESVKLHRDKKGKSSISLFLVRLNIGKKVHLKNVPETEEKAKIGSKVQHGDSLNRNSFPNTSFNSRCKCLL